MPAARSGRVDVVVYDLVGREVRSVAKGLWLDAGPQSLRWDGRLAYRGSAGAGVYFVQLLAGDGRWTRIVIRVP